MEYVNAYRIGKEQLLIFAATVVGVLATDLLIGVLIGVLVKMGVHLANGVPLSMMFKPYLEVEEVNETTSRIVARGSAVFSNWIPVRRQIEDIGLVQRRNLESDLSPKHGTAHFQEIRRMADRIGIAISGVCSFLFWPYPLTSNDPAKRQRGLELAGKIAECAHDLGTRNVLVVPGAVCIPWRTDHEPVPNDVCLTRAKDAVSRMIALANPSTLSSFPVQTLYTAAAPSRQRCIEVESASQTSPTKTKSRVCWPSPKTVTPAPRRSLSAKIERTPE
jgi:hypothetical protein